jgi:hypothetical protein
LSLEIEYRLEDRTERMIKREIRRARQGRAGQGRVRTAGFEVDDLRDRPLE